MHFFNRKFSLIILFATLPLLFLPKINLLSLGGTETAGLRIDDIILCFLSIILMWAHAYSHEKFYRIEGLILALTGFSLLSFLFNRFFVSLDLLPIDARIFYVFRLVEYFLFFYIGGIASQFLSDRVIIRAFFLWNLLFMILQKLSLLGGVTVEGYQGDVSGRIQGIASFPSEMGLILNLLFCYFIFDDSNKSKSPSKHILYLYGLFFLFALLVIFTGNRISILALILCFVFRLKEEARTSPLAFLFVPILIGGITYALMQTTAVYERSFALFSFKNIELFSLVWDKIAITEIPLAGEAISSEYDMSWWIRIHKWLFITKSYLYHPECYLQGLGPGYAGAALDGGWLRICTEYGVIGAYLFWKFFSSLYSLNKQTKWMIIAFSINMIFFDAYLAYKLMSLLLFICGYVFEKSERAVLVLSEPTKETS